MNVIDAIKQRRSVRKYSDKSVSEELVMELMDAARLAPSGNNAQPWIYKIISKPEDIELLKKEDIFKQSFVYTAPILILCCADPRKYPGAEFDKKLDDANTLRAIRDLSISVQNLVLRATELGLGTCYIGWMDKPRIKELYNLPPHYIVPYLITVGYAEGQGKPAKKKEMSEILLK